MHTQSTRTPHYVYSNSTSKMPLSELPIVIYSSFSTVMSSVPLHRSHQEFVRLRCFSCADNGHSHGPLPIRCSLRQGCLLTMALCALCLQLLLKMMVLPLPGIQTGRSAHPVSIVAYADDLSIFLNSVADFSIIEEAICQY